MNLNVVPYYTYILRSLKDGRYYYGSTSNLENRVHQHNKGLVKATRPRKPFELHYFEEFSTRSEAFNREMFFKSIEGYKWLKENKIT